MKAKFFDGEDQVDAEEHETYGFKIKRTPNQIQQLQAFEEDIIKWCKTWSLEQLEAIS